MNEELINKAYNLKEAINVSLTMKNLLEAEQELENNDEAKILSYKMDVEASHYSDILKIYPSDSKEAKEAQHKLYLAKKELDELEVVKKYNKAYKEAKLLFNDINRILFSKYMEEGCNIK